MIHGGRAFGYEKSTYVICCDDAMGKDKQEISSLGKGVEIEDVATRLGYLELADSGTIFWIMWIV